MDDYIKRSDALDAICDDCDRGGDAGDCATCQNVKAVRDEIPAADVVPVVHGHWIVIDDDYTWDDETGDEVYRVLECECSECGERTQKDRPNFCDNCGAKMDGGVEDGK